jgi:hypothetical protein
VGREKSCSSRSTKLIQIHELIAFVTEAAAAVREIASNEPIVNFTSSVEAERGKQKQRAASHWARCTALCGLTAIVTPHRNNGQGQGCSRNYAKFNATLGLMRIVSQPVNR